MEESRRDDLFAYDDYRAYLAVAIARGRFGERGPRTQLASAAGCQAAYVSQVLKGESNFSLEQGDAISSFLGHKAEERSYFLDLIQLARAGTQDLRAFFLGRLQRLGAEQLRQQPPPLQDSATQLALVISRQLTLDPAAALALRERLQQLMQEALAASAAQPSSGLRKYVLQVRLQGL